MILFNWIWSRFKQRGLELCDQFLQANPEVDICHAPPRPRPPPRPESDLSRETREFIGKYEQFLLSHCGPRPETCCIYNVWMKHCSDRQGYTCAHWKTFDLFRMMFDFEEDEEKK